MSDLKRQALKKIRRELKELSSWVKYNVKQDDIERQKNFLKSILKETKKKIF